MRAPLAILAVVLSIGGLPAGGASARRSRSWTADNGNGTYSNPLFYDEFSDPDMIRVGRDMHSIGWTSPSFRYRNGTYYIFSNVNHFGRQVFRASNPRGPWKHNRIPQQLHDLSVLFDDDGKIYAVYGAREIRIVELNPDLTAVVPGTDGVLLDRDRGMGQGSHFYKIKGRYYIVSAVPGAHTPMKCARAGTIGGPWEVTTISEKESSASPRWTACA